MDQRVLLLERSQRGQVQLNRAILSAFHKEGSLGTSLQIDFPRMQNVGKPNNLVHQSCARENTAGPGPLNFHAVVQTKLFSRATSLFLRLLKNPSSTSAFKVPSNINATTLLKEEHLINYVQEGSIILPKVA